MYTQIYLRSCAEKKIQPLIRANDLVDSETAYMLLYRMLSICLARRTQ